MVRRGGAGSVKARQARLGWAWHGKVRLVEARQAGSGEAGCGEAGPGRARFVKARLSIDSVWRGRWGLAGQGRARCGKAS